MFEFENVSQDAKLIVDVFDEDQDDCDELMGKAVITVDAIPFETRVEEWYPLISDSILLC